MQYGDEVTWDVATEPFTVDYIRIPGIDLELACNWG